MPANNAPSAAQTDVEANDEGKAVLMNPFSGPIGSPFDRDSGTLAGNCSTGGMSTGVGFGLNRVLGAVGDAGVADNYTPGVTKPDGNAATDATLIAIGGGHSNATSGGYCTTTPYDEQPLLFFGNGIARDAGTLPAMVGHGSKLVTASGTVVQGGVVETGFTNQSGQTITTGQSVFGSTTADSPAITPDYLSPAITGDATPTIYEPGTTVGTYTADPAGVTWSISGGTDAALFEIDATTGVLSFIDPTTAGGPYDVWIEATYQTSSNQLVLAVTVDAIAIVGDTTPAVTAPATTVETYTSTPASTDWSIEGGVDAALFTINGTTGALAFIDPSVAGPYEVTIRATVGEGYTDEPITVTVS